MRIRDQRGFTIMELLIVIVVIGILAAIAVPAYNSFTAKAQSTACKANLRTIQTVIGIYYAEHGSYPADDADLQEADIEAWTDADGNKYIDDASKLKCPTDDTYSLAAGVVSCSVHGTP
jgi:type II secretion system protein G